MGMLNRKEYAGWKPGQKVKPKTETGPGLTKQEFAKEADMNWIMERYTKTGVLPQGALQHLAPVFADVAQFGDFSDMMRRMTSAQDAFLQLPADLRARFNNDPVQLIAFIQDDKNYDEAVKLGIVVKKDPPKEDPLKEPPKADPPK